MPKWKLSKTRVRFPPPPPPHLLCLGTANIKATSVAGKTCQTTTYSAANIGFRDIVQMNSERTYIKIGNTTDLENDGYPSTVYANKYYKFN